MVRHLKKFFFYITGNKNISGFKYYRMDLEASLIEYFNFSNFLNIFSRPSKDLINTLYNLAVYNQLILFLY